MDYNQLPEEPINASALGANSSSMITDNISVIDEQNMNNENNDSYESLPEAKVLNPMSAWAGSATIINLVLATGPFAYPYAFVMAGMIPSVCLILFTLLIAYMTATFMIEGASVACAKRYTGRSDTLFPLINGEDPKRKLVRDQVDMDVKDSPFYIRQKLEIGTLAEDFVPKWVKFVLFFFLILYMYGAMCLKYVAGAESLVQGISTTFWNREDDLEKKIGFDPYYIALLIFASISIYFSFGNIENAKVLQIVTTIMRFLTTFLMIIGSIISMGRESGGVAPARNLIDYDLEYMHILFGNTIFIFI
jgi:amino acid permease